MKWFRRAVTMLVAFSLLAASAAPAELRRGDRGDLVYQIQESLRGGGWLGDEPDGIFGQRTEQAIIAFQECYDYEPNGVLNDMQINHILYGAEYLPDEFYTDGAGADGRGVENYCYSETRSTGYSYETKTTYCEAHSWIVAPADASLRNGAPEDAATMYEEAVMGLYSELWAQITDDEAGDFVKSAVASFNHMMDAQMQLLELWYGASEPQVFQAKRAELLRAQMVFLCGIVNGEENG